MNPQILARWTRFGAALVTLSLSAAAFADVDVEVRNGDKIDGTFDPAGEIETFRVFLPRGARLSVAAKGKKAKGAAGVPVPSFRVLDPDGAETGTSAIVGSSKGAKLSGHEIAASGEHMIVVTGNGTAGDYQLAIKWTSPTKTALNGTLAPTPVEVPFAADPGAKLTFKVKSGAGLPRLLEVRDAADTVVATFPPPAADAKSQTAKNVTFPAGGDFRLIVGDGGVAGGTFASAITIKPPAPSSRKVGLTTKQIGAVGLATAVGRVFGPEGGSLAIDSVPALEGSSVVLPPGALKLPSVVVLATSPPFTVKETSGAGPTVFFGPEGLTFAQPVTVTIPFDLAVFAGDFSKLVVYTRDANGKTRKVTDVTIDGVAGTVSFPTSHFSSFRVFREGGGPVAPLPVPLADLNDDGIDDLVVPAPAVSSNRGSVFVFFGSTTFASTTSAAASATFPGAVSSGEYGAAVATGDLSGDGIADLVIGSPGNAQGQVLVFFGRSGFTGEATSGADVTLFSLPTDGRLGASLAIGDVNGDGTDDLIIGAPDSGAGNTAGAVYVFFGGPTFGSESTATSDIQLTGQQDDSFGFSVACGDVTGDRMKDVIVGATRDEGNGTGSLFVFKGGPGRLASGGSGSRDFQFNDAEAGADFGWQVAVGDVNGDGDGDLVGSAVFSTDTQSGNGGAVYVFHGGSSFANRSTAQANVTLRGEFANSTFGTGLEVGDIDADGDAELITGSGGDDELGSNGGAIFIFGRDGDPVAQGNRAKISTLSNSLLMSVVLRPVDLTDDGRRELIFAAPRADVGGNNAGAVYIATGSLPGVNTQAPIIIDGSGNDVFLGGR